MKKLILSALILLSWSPYLFLATSVETTPIGERAFNCTIQSAGPLHQTVGFGAHYYRPLRNRASLKGGVIVLPYFFSKEELFYAHCGDEQFSIGYADFLKVGEKIHVYTEIATVKFFGHELFKEERSVNGFGTGWEGKNEGETVLTRLENDKEVKYFHGKPVPPKLNTYSCTLYTLHGSYAHLKIDRTSLEDATKDAEKVRDKLYKTGTIPDCAVQCAKVKE